MRRSNCETSQAEVAYHRQLWLRETAWEEEDTADYLDYLADFRAEFHDLREISAEQAEALRRLSFADQLRGFAGTCGAVAGTWLGGNRLSQRPPGGGTCIACFRPVLVTNVRKGYIFTITVSRFASTPPTIRRG